MLFVSPVSIVNSSNNTSEAMSNLSAFTVNASFETSIFNTSYQTQPVQPTKLSKELDELEKQLNELRASYTSYDNESSAMSSSALINQFNNYRNEVEAVKTSFKNETVSNTSLNARLAAAGYDANTSRKLAAQSVKETAGRKQSTGWCAKNVNNALEKSGIVEKNSTRTASAYQLANVYANCGAFTEVKVSKNELKNLPAGCVIVWQPGKGFGNAFAKHGHVVITQGNNKATSDYSQEIKDYGTSFRVFVPKKAA